jgi:hypothetical protein
MCEQPTTGILHLRSGEANVPWWVFFIPLMGVEAPASWREERFSRGECEAETKFGDVPLPPHLLGGELACGETGNASLCPTRTQGRWGRGEGEMKNWCIVIAVEIVAASLHISLLLTMVLAVAVRMAVEI